MLGLVVTACAETERPPFVARQGDGVAGAAGSGAGNGGAAGASHDIGDDAGVPPPDAGSSGASGGGGSSADDAGQGEEPPPPVACTKGTYSGDVTVTSQAALAALAGYAAIDGNVHIGSDAEATTPDVRTLQPLRCLQTISGELTLQGNPELLDLQGLEQLTQVAALRVTDNEVLGQLYGPRSLAVAGLLLVRANPSLRDLAGGITSAGALVVEENPELPDCQAQLLAEALGVACTCSGNGGGSCT